MATAWRHGWSSHARQEERADKDCRALGKLPHACLPNVGGRPVVHMVGQAASGGVLGHLRMAGQASRQGLVCQSTGRRAPSTLGRWLAAASALALPYTSPAPDAVHPCLPSRLTWSMKDGSSHSASMSSSAKPRAASSSAAPSPFSASGSSECERRAAQVSKKTSVVHGSSHESTPGPTACCPARRIITCAVGRLYRHQLGGGSAAGPIR